MIGIYKSTYKFSEKGIIKHNISADFFGLQSMTNGLPRRQIDQIFRIRGDRFPQKQKAENPQKGSPRQTNEQLGPFCISYVCAAFQHKVAVDVSKQQAKIMNKMVQILPKIMCIWYLHTCSTYNNIKTKNSKIMLLILPQHILG